VIKENKSVVLSKGKKGARSDLEDEFLDKSGKGKESKSFPVPKGHSLERVPRRKWRVKRIVVFSGLGLNRVIRQLFLAFELIRDGNVHGEARTREGKRKPLRNGHVGGNGRLLVPGEETLRDEADQSFEIY
jgi:hypothetical protein